MKCKQKELQPAGICLQAEAKTGVVHVAPHLPVYPAVFARRPEAPELSGVELLA